MTPWESVIFIFLLLIVRTYHALQNGDACMTKNLNKGMCRPFRQCPVAFGDWKKYNVLPSVCQYSVSMMEHIICCDVRRSRHFFQKFTEGSTCTASNGVKGICRMSTTCPELENALVTSTCSNNHRSQVNRAIVCCPDYHDDNSNSNSNSNNNDLSSLSSSNNNHHRDHEYNETPENYRKIQETRKISIKKCHEYSKWSPLQTKSGPCEFTKPNLMILGGIEAGPLEFPHQVHLGYGEDRDDWHSLSWECGGSLISEEFILTAAHCMANRNGFSVQAVRLAYGQKLSNLTKKVLERISHPGYKPPETYNDIALLRIERLAQFNRYVRPACLHTTKKIDSETGIATGWGITERRKKSEKLLKVELPFLDTPNCSLTYKASRFLERGLDDETMLCAGGLMSKKDACQGDSGGPLQIISTTAECMYSIVGIVSFGVLCGVAPGVYTRVSSYIPWIENYVWPHQ